MADTRPYILFVGMDYLLSGGMKDYGGAFTTVDEAKSRAENHPSWSADWAQIVVAEPTGLRTIWEGESGWHTPSGLAWKWTEVSGDG